jgi:AraC-like DNA-binding protein
MALTQAAPEHGLGPDPRRVEALEVDEFTSGVAGVPIEYVRTDEGFGPAVATQVGSPDLMISTGGLGFSAVAVTEIPADMTVFAHVDAAPPGSMWNGVELVEGDIHVFAPGANFLATEPAGLAASILVTPVTALWRIAADLQHEIDLSRSVTPLALGPGARGLAGEIRLASSRLDEVIGGPSEQRLLEAAVRAIADHGHTQVARRLDSKVIVRACLDYVDGTESHSPSISELCRASHTSESRLREAFIDVFDLPPTRYFRLRLLSRLREELVVTSPERSTVSFVASRLGITQFGRIAGEYRNVFGELPSQTLRRPS